MGPVTAGPAIAPRPPAFTDVRIVRRGQPEYPRFLAEIPGPPARLFVAGRPLEPAPHVAVVGTRRASRYGLEVAFRLGEALAASGVVVVSGLAAGIDAAAHRGALEAGGVTVAVLGCGIDVCYPKGNASLYRAIADRGTLVSQHPPGTQPLAHHFPARNRIIAGLSLGAVVVEGRARGGAMITARLALELGREVFAVAGPVHAPGSEGPHALIRDGARLVASAADILDDLELCRWPPPAGEAPALSPDELQVLGVLEAEPVLLDLIAKASGMPASTSAAILARLELKGLACRSPGGRFARAVPTL